LKNFFPPTYFFISLIISVLLHFVLPISKIINFPFNLIGFLFFIVGTGLNIWADQLFKKESTTVKPFDKPSSLVQTGPFKFSRNPMYLGMTLLLIGAGFILGSITSFVGAVLFILSMEIIFIAPEEANLLKNFGEEFKNYKKTVRKWI